MLPTAAYAPVVGYYDREQEDFVGHAPEQAIYGIIDPKIEPVFEVLDDGNVWAVVDVVLYTERPGEVGEIAKKIVGHKQSLELNPETVKYKITERRPGDIATCYSNPEKAKKELGWEAEKTLEDMCKDSWRYIQNQTKENT